MIRDGLAALQELQSWLTAGAADAERWLPELLDLPASLLRGELDSRPELRTAAMMQRLIRVARDARERFPARARELTAVAVEYTASLAIPPPRASIGRRLHAQAWREHAHSLNGVGEVAQARHAIGVARELLQQVPASGWDLATADLIEAEIIHDLGQPDQALRLVRQAAAQFALHRDQEHYIEARMMETWIIWTGGDDAAATAVWNATAEGARQHGDSKLMARLGSKIGVFELRHGDAEKASRLLAAALEIFDAAGLTREATRTRWHLAETMVERGRGNEAISEYHKVRAELLATGALTDAALVSAEILNLLLATVRDDEVAPLARTFLFSFRDAGMFQNALDAFIYVRARAEAGQLTHDDVTAMRRYFEDAAVHPNAWFVAP
jgi:hypothetical protein